jgi:hypothetical protein
VQRNPSDGEIAKHAVQVLTVIRESMTTVMKEERRRLTMHFVVFPANTLRNPDGSPFSLRQKTESAGIIGAE